MARIFMQRTCWLKSKEKHLQQLRCGQAEYNCLIKRAAQELVLLAFFFAGGYKVGLLGRFFFFPLAGDDF